MKKIDFKKVVLAVTTIAIVGTGANAFAQWGTGYGSHGQMGGNNGWHQNGPHGGMGYYHQNLSQEEVARLEQERLTFFRDTDELRREIYAKRLELEAELAKRNPDIEKSTILQSKLSALQSRMDQKRVAHMAKMRKNNPNASMGYMGMGGCRWSY